MHTGIFQDIDFQANGKSITFLSIPFSIDRSPYFQVKVPVCRVRNGEGPRVLLMAGVHGDEYEGEIALTQLIRRLQPDRMRGEITILPFANAPAVFGARRRSPLDDGNLNRAFPGDANGTPTARVAQFLEHELFPRHDVVFDLHSGGTSMAHLPCALIERQGSPETFTRAVSLMDAMGMPYGLVAENGALAPTSMAAAARAGAIGLSGEFGGGGTVTPATMALTRRAIDQVLLTLGSITDPVLGMHAPIEQPTQLISLQSHQQAIYATRRGWFEPAVRCGDVVEAGAVAGWYHDFELLDLPEEELRVAVSGVVISQRLHSHAEAGDCLLQVGCRLDRRSIDVV